MIAVTKYKFIELQFIAALLALTQLFLLSINILLGLTVIAIAVPLLLQLKKNYLFFAYFCWSIFLQNGLIAYVSPLLNNQFTFSLLHGINFFISAYLLFLWLIQNPFLSKPENRILINISLILFLLLAFTGLGFLFYGLKNSVAYLRLFSFPLLLLSNGLYFSRHISSAFFIKQFKAILWLTVGLGILQFLFPKPLSFLLLDLPYYKLKVGEQINDFDKLIHYFKRNSFFNIPGTPLMLRASSLIKSTISLGYFVVILSSIFYFPSRKRIWLFFLFSATLLVHSKGAILLIVLFLFVWILWKKLKLSFPSTFMLVLLSWLLIVLLGIKTHNEHIIGFMSGLSYMDTLGNGLGFGGNLSDIRLTSINGRELPDLGYWTRFQNGSESVFGVLFSSLGIFSLVYILLFFAILKRIYKQLTVNGHISIGIIVILLFFQGIFQEEVFSPFVYGVALFIAGYYFNIMLNETDSVVQR